MDRFRPGDVRHAANSPTSPGNGGVGGDSTRSASSRYHLANGQREQALESFNDALRLNPQFVQAYVAARQALCRVADNTKAFWWISISRIASPADPRRSLCLPWLRIAFAGAGFRRLCPSGYGVVMDTSYARVHFLRGQAMQILAIEPPPASVLRWHAPDPTLWIYSQVVTAHQWRYGRSRGSTCRRFPVRSRRTPVMSELMPEHPEPQPFDPDRWDASCRSRIIPISSDVATSGNHAIRFPRRRRRPPIFTHNLPRETRRPASSYHILRRRPRSPLNCPILLPAFRSMLNRWNLSSGSDRSVNRRRKRDSRPRMPRRQAGRLQPKVAK